MSSASIRYYNLDFAESSTIFAGEEKTVAYIQHIIHTSTCTPLIVSVKTHTDDDSRRSECGELPRLPVVTLRGRMSDDSLVLPAIVRSEFAPFSDEMAIFSLYSYDRCNFWVGMNENYKQLQWNVFVCLNV